MNRHSITKSALVVSMVLGTFMGTLSVAEAAPTLRSKALKSAHTQKGAKYVYGRQGGYSKGYDCSGLTYWAYKQHGKVLPRTAQGQRNKTKKISAKNRKVGDLVFIHDRSGRVYHVGILSKIVKGRGWILNANSGRTTAHKVGEWPLKNYTDGSPYATYGRF